MAAALEHRGPDDEGVWADERVGLALGFRRLAILDLSPLGHQPMVSGSGRYVIAFNGEVYNFAELRHELEAKGHTFRGGSDTEVMLAAFEEWGVIQATRRFVGMFAFAVWDATKRAVTLVRDPIGVKPMYYGRVGGVVVFGSELKALRAHPAFVPHMDADAVALYMRHSYVPAPHSVYSGISKLMPGTAVVYDAQADQGRLVTYWSLLAAAEAGLHQGFDGSEDDAVDALDGLLRDSVRLQVVADVPVGAFLSGGVDSSLVVALMQRQTNGRVRTFSIGFREPGFDEVPFAEAVAGHLQTDHTTMYVTHREALGVIPELATVYDEPFADSSQIPTLLLARLTRQHVTVSLSGDGGDELFGGYEQYWRCRKRWRQIQAVPRLVRPAAHCAGLAASTAAAQLPGLLGARVAASLRSRSAALGSSTFDGYYEHSLLKWGPADRIMVHGKVPPYLANSHGAWLRSAEQVDRMMYLDTALGLPDDMLVKVDRASCAVSLEARVPLLDPRLVEFAWRLPLAWKVRAPGSGKWVLRRVLHRYVPEYLVDRPKRGFGIPVGTWLRGPLRDWAEDLVSRPSISESGLLRYAAVRSRWRETLRTDHPSEQAMWTVLMFQAWHRRWMR